MKVVFVYNGAEHYGIEQLSSFLKSKGHEVELVFDPAIFSGDQLINSDLLARLTNIDNKVIKKAIEAKPDIVAFSSYTGNYKWCLDIAKKIKDLIDVPVVFGGFHPTAVPDIVMKNDFIDYTVVGEGEFTMLDIIEHVKNGTNGIELKNIPNLCFRDGEQIVINPPRPYLRDLDELPFPDKELFYNKVPLLEQQLMILTSRGCPYSCTYCSNNMLQEVYDWEKQHIRRRSPQNVIEELVYYKKRGNVKLVNFLDDVFTLSRSWLEEFIPEYKAKIGLPFFCYVHPNTIKKEVIALLKEGGCWLVTMGVQSGSERLRKEIFHRKGSNEKIIDAVTSLKENGIKVSVDNIFGAPTETEEDLQQGMDLYNVIKSDRIMTIWLTYYPRTQIVQYAKQEGILSENDELEIENGKTGFAHGGGSVSDEKIPVYNKYQILFQLRSLINNDKVFEPLSKIALALPMKGLIGKLIIIMNAVKNKDVKFLYLLKYLWAKKNTP